MNNFLALILILTLFSCKKKDTSAEPEEPSTTSGTPGSTTNGTVTSADLAVNITNVAGALALSVSKDTIYNTSMKKYINSFGDTFTVTKWRYYISNIRLKKADGNYFSENESYRLIDASDSSGTCKFNLKNVPGGSYSNIEFLIGVDSLRNCSGAQKGALDVANNMFWTWNSGYIFMKIEAYTSTFPSAGAHNIEYHIGGFMGAGNNIRKVVLPFSSNLAIDSKPAKIYLKADIQECLKTPNTISFKTLSSASNPFSAKPLAENYADMFSVSAIAH